MKTPNFLSFFSFGQVATGFSFPKWKFSYYIQDGMVLISNPFSPASAQIRGGSDIDDFSRNII
jgi:hypothetical protein